MAVIPQPRPVLTKLRQTEDGSIWKYAGLNGEPRHRIVEVDLFCAAKNEAHEAKLAVSGSVRFVSSIWPLNQKARASFTGRRICHRRDLVYGRKKEDDEATD